MPVTDAPHPPCCVSCGREADTDRGGFENDVCYSCGAFTTWYYPCTRPTCPQLHHTPAEAATCHHATHRP